MYYKEFLRVRNTFVGFAIAIAAVALLVLSLSGHASVAVDVAAAATAPHAGPAAVASPSSTTNMSAPGIEVSDLNRAPWAIVLAIAGLVSAIFATVVGTCLASENCGHLEVAWTRPASRVSYASRLMLVDVIGIFAMFAFTVLISVALIYVRGWQHAMYMDRDLWPLLIRFVAYPLAWFGLIAALTASVRGKAGAIAGFSWLATGLLIVLLGVDLPPAIHTVIRFLDYINPMLYGSYSSGAEAAKHVAMVTPTVAIIGLSGITLVGIAAALAQWRRLEA